ncbi:MAG: hydrogenase iron-sulfur subunit, partial [Gemmatimonadota bacterium]
VPWLTRPREEHRPAPSTVDEAICTGCTHCAQDCPWEAITMLPRTDGRAELVARVDPTLCVSCGLCAGSCAPMGVGPPGRTGRDQLELLRRYLVASPVTGRDVVVIGCARGGAGGSGAEALSAAGARVYPIDCVGNLHTSVIEFLVRGGAGGVLVLGCPPRDCWNREGPRWLEARLHHGREAELQDRVDRRRVHMVSAGAREPGLAVAEFTRFQAAVDGLMPPEAEPDLQLEAVCEAALAAVEDK